MQDSPRHGRLKMINGASNHMVVKLCAPPFPYIPAASGCASFPQVGATAFVFFFLQVMRSVLRSGVKGATFFQFLDTYPGQYPRLYSGVILRAEFDGGPQSVDVTSGAKAAKKRRLVGFKFKKAALSGIQKSGKGAP